MLDIAPAHVMVVRADGRVEMEQPLADLFGLSDVPDTLDQVVGNDAVLSPDDSALLDAEITAAQKAARPFRLTVRVVGGNRTLMVVGQRAPDALRAPGGVVLWVFDATESQAEVSRLAEEGARYREAFEALTGLIQAAPMPMWYRDATLKLAMVNSAYVEAVAGKSAETVVAGGIELVDAS
ncbi:MAG: histidine kinase, partial [Alphaproteobacteria bacterium HGW-Alphaproteobacteria-15]